MDLGGESAEPSPVALALDQLATSLDHLVKLVEDGGLDGVDDTGLVGFLQGFERIRNRMPLVDHRVIADAQARDLPETLCQGSMRRVLTAALRISPAEAARRVRSAAAVGPRTSPLGEALGPYWVELAAAQRTGEVSTEHVGVVARALAKVDHRGFDPDDLTAAEHLLTSFATQFGPPDLARLADQVVDAIDPDGTRPDDDLNHDRRFFRLRPTRDGAWTGEFRLTGPLGAKLSALLDPLATPRTDTTTTEDPGNGKGSAPTAGRRSAAGLDPRHHGQRMHDALDDLCDRLLRASGLPDHGGTPTTVLVTVDIDDLLTRTGYGVTSDGTLIPTSTVNRLANNADLYFAVTTATGCVLNLGRTRRIATPAQTRALTIRDRGCSFPGCTTRPEWCERHHIRDWADGGTTDLDNLTMLCSYHHHHFAARGWTCRMTNGLPEWTPPRWIDPQQKPLRNTRTTTHRIRQHRRRQQPRATDPPSRT